MKTINIKELLSKIKASDYKFKHSEQQFIAEMEWMEATYKCIVPQDKFYLLSLYKKTIGE